MMKYGKLIIEENQYVILKKLLNLSSIDHSKTVKGYILKLQNELREAIVLSKKEMPQDVVRLNSLVTVITKDKLWKKTFELVLPSKNNILDNKISLLLPMGAAVLGYAKGDAILWEFPGGLKELKVLDVVQVD
ncbi:GreA/GreB family elongation factor [Polaribacter sp. MSW13]|uniref:GreA/GreB family elongation factor n=1 Tax=Polaribacter marinus TaxID=2916838 RepID=A0A9X1VU91_9FLAO|nr:GreA/GreB family elongation factor [Polaribacter marinus]MCI2229651.1 GreA/GreB family elongation factor [Polaribacter marinus]